MKNDMDIEKALDILEKIREDTYAIGLYDLSKRVSRAKYYLLDYDYEEYESIKMAKNTSEI